MVGNLLARAGGWMLRKSVVFSFSAGAAAEQIRKFYAVYPEIARAVGWGEPSWSGKTLDEWQALNLSTVWACYRVIAETVASLPLHLMAYTVDGKVPADGVDEHPKHPLYRVLHDQPNDEMSDDTLRETLTGHCLLWGNAYAQIIRRSTGARETIGLYPWKPTDTRADRVQADKRLVFIHKDGNDPEKTWETGDVFHLAGLGYDGVTGHSVVTFARQSLGLAAVQDEYVSRFFAAGGRKPYYLKKGTKFRTDQDFERFREKWDAAYGSANHFHQAPILEGDIELKELGMPLEDAQLLASRQFSVAEICRWFRVPPHLVGDLDRATFTNIEHQGQEFIQQTLMRWLVRWEKAINRQLLTNDEKSRYYAKHNVNALLRGDFASRMAGYSTALQNGVYSINDVRDLEDWNPIEGGDDHHIQLNMQSLPGGEPTAGQQAALVKVGTSNGAGRNGRRGN